MGSRSENTGTVPLERIDSCRFRIPQSYAKGMRVDGLLFSSDEMIAELREDKALEQVVNVAHLPGIVGRSLAMPDIHWGYGFCIGGVAATELEHGVISPGGVGYDINCGVRLIRTNIPLEKAQLKLERLVDLLFTKIPAGVGQGGSVVFDKRELAAILERGAAEVIRRGFGWGSDLEVTESQGVLEGANSDLVSDRAYERGREQCGTLGSGNHFLEVQVVEEIFDAEAATVMGLLRGHLCVMIHSGSRGLGYQVCEDALRDMRDTPRKYGILLPDRQLVCAPVYSPEGVRYLGAMRAAANFAWANRQIMTHLTREAFEETFLESAEELGMEVVYDVAHNIAKFEEHLLDGRLQKVCVHRKGATRAFPPGHPEVPERYRHIGQPVLIPGDMGRYSFVLVGEPQAMVETFGSTCHGAGRRLSRTAAVRAARGRSITDELRLRGVYARARSRTGLEEEQPEAYKDANDVVDVVARAGISRKVVKLRPIGVVKG